MENIIICEKIIIFFILYFNKYFYYGRIISIVQGGFVMGLKISNLFKEESDKESNSVEEEFYSISERNYKEEEAQSGSKMILVEPRAKSERKTIDDK